MKLLNTFTLPDFIRLAIPFIDNSIEIALFMYVSQSKLMIKNKVKPKIPAFLKEGIGTSFPCSDLWDRLNGELLDDCSLVSKGYQ